MTGARICTAVLVVACAAGCAARQPPRPAVTVLEVRGAGGADWQARAAELAEARHYRVIPAETYWVMATRLKAVPLTARNVARVAAAVGATAVVHGRVTGAKRRRVVTIYVRAGDTGRVTEKHRVRLRRSKRARGEAAFERRLLASLPEPAPDQAGDAQPAAPDRRAARARPAGKAKTPAVARPAGKAKTPAVARSAGTSRATAKAAPLATAKAPARVRPAARPVAKRPARTDPVAKRPVKAAVAKRPARTAPVAKRPAQAAPAAKPRAPAKANRTAAAKPRAPAKANRTAAAKPDPPPPQPVEYDNRGQAIDDEMPASLR